MGSVWRRPSLLGLELLWRWSAGLPLLALGAWQAANALHGIRPDLAALESMTVFKPAEAAAIMGQQLALIVPPLLPFLSWFVPLALVMWTIASALGRTAIWRRLDPALRPRYAATALLGAARSVALLCLLALWLWGLVAAGRYSVIAPIHAGAEPNLVLYAALAVALTLLLFMVWSLTVWVLDAAPLFAMSANLSLGQSLRAAARSRSLRSKLMETNLVMGIVKVCLLVLAMVFSASPLPFETVETQSFLLIWWVFIGALYLVASDLFHVIRRAAYLALFRALASPLPDTIHGPQHGS